MQRVEIKYEGHSVGVVPECGGGLAWFRSDVEGAGGPWSWLRETPEGPITSPLDLACFPLAPFSNRICDAQFIYAGQSVTLHPNFPPETHAIHGVAWQSAWQVERQAASEISLRLDWLGGDWPWRFEAQITYALGDDGLKCSLRVWNRDTRTMPSGLGWHPYFKRTSDVTLHADANGLVCNDNRMLPSHVDWQAPALAKIGTGQALPIGLDNELVNWTGPAHIHWPRTNQRLRIGSEPQADWAILFTPANQDFFCFEPVTHLTNAHNQGVNGIENTGLVQLAPGEMQALTMFLAPMTAPVGCE